MSETYKLSWEIVSPAKMYFYMDSRETQLVSNSQIPDEEWYPVSRETDDPWDQYNQLRAWDNADTGFVRNVRLERMVSAPEWVSVAWDAGRTLDTRA